MWKFCASLIIVRDDGKIFYFESNVWGCHFIRRGIHLGLVLKFPLYSHIHVCLWRTCSFSSEAWWKWGSHFFNPNGFIFVIVSFSCTSFPIGAFVSYFLNQDKVFKMNLFHCLELFYKKHSQIFRENNQDFIFVYFELPSLLSGSSILDTLSISKRPGWTGLCYFFLLAPSKIIQLAKSCSENKAKLF